MKGLVDRLEWLRVSILDEKTGITDTAARQNALDVLIEASAIAEILPEITISLPEPPPGKRRVLVNRGSDTTPSVFNGGRRGAP